MMSTMLLTCSRRACYEKINTIIFGGDIFAFCFFFEKYGTINDFLKMFF